MSLELMAGAEDKSPKCPDDVSSSITVILKHLALGANPEHWHF